MSSEKCGGIGAGFAPGGGALEGDTHRVPRRAGDNCPVTTANLPIPKVRRNWEPSLFIPAPPEAGLTTDNGPISEPQTVRPPAERGPRAVKLKLPPDAEAKLVA